VTDIWTSCAEQAKPVAIGGDLLRMVESQAQVATSALVDDLAEQALLEGLIETSKPPLRPGSEGLDYLLAAPFRYPPLRHGSRFGTRFEPGIFYGSKALSTVLAETAYYRLVFWTAMAVPPPGGRLLTQHTLLGARYRSERGLRLQASPFDRFESVLTDPFEYGPTQRLGSDLRSAGIQAFEYLSARTARRALNVALLDPVVLASRKAQTRGQWLCETRADRVSFSAAADASVEHFPIDRVLVDGRLPRPAA
jgi:hypothetical protein